MKKRSYFIKTILLLILVILVGCTPKLSEENKDAKVVVEEDINENKVETDNEYLSVDYKALENLDGNLEVGTKVQINGQIYFKEGVTVYDIESQQYLESIWVSENENIIVSFMYGDFSSDSEAANYSNDRFNEIWDKEGTFYLEYLGNMESGVPACLLDKVDIAGKIYDREYLGDISNIIGTLNNPAKIGEWLKYEDYYFDESLELNLIEVIKGEEAKRVIAGFDESNISLLKDKEVIMAKFEIYNSGEPIDISYLDFKYANESFAATNTSPYLKNIKDEINFTIFSGKEAEGWVIFEIDPENIEGYAVFKNELWFKLF